MGIILFLVSVIVAGLICFKNRAVLTGSDKSKKIKPILFAVIAFVLINIISGIQPIKATRANAADEVVKINLVGSDRGIDKEYKYATGWIFYNQYYTQIIETPKSNRQVEFANLDVTALGGAVLKASPSFSYKIKPGTSGDMYINQRKPLEEVEDDWLKTTVKNSINDVTSAWQVDSIFVKKTVYEKAISNEINRRVGKWFEVEQFRTNIVPPDFLKESIQAKTKAVQDVEVARERKKAADAEGLTKIAIAKADSADRVIRALADARVNQLKGEKLTDKILEEQRIKAWEAGGSQVPTTFITGSGGANFLHTLTGKK